MRASSCSTVDGPSPPSTASPRRRPQPARLATNPSTSPLLDRQWWAGPELRLGRSAYDAILSILEPRFPSSTPTASSMASTTFRESMNSLGWSRRDPDLPVSTSSTSTPVLSRLQALNPFGDRGYVRLPTQEEGPGAPLPAPSRREEEEGFFACECSSPLSPLPSPFPGWRS